MTYTNDINDSGLEEGEDEDDGDNEIIAEVTNANSDVEHNNVTGSDAEIKENGSDFIQKVQEASGDNRTSLDEVNKSDEVPEGNFHSSSKDSGIDQSNGWRKTATFSVDYSVIKNEKNVWNTYVASYKLQW